jgi:hypothetical protein
MGISIVSQDFFKIIISAAGLEVSKSHLSECYTEVDSQPVPSSSSENANASVTGEEEDLLTTNDDETHEQMQALRLDAQDVALEKLRAEIRVMDVAVDGNKIDNSLRQKMADMTFYFMVCWCTFVAVVFFIYLACNDGKPPVGAIIALLGTSSLSIIGLVGFVVSGLFKSQKKE